MANLPPEGVSSITEEGSRVPVSSPVAAQRREKRRKAFANTRKLDTGEAPPGVVTRDISVVDVPIQNWGEEKYITEFLSKDGQKYRFRTHSNDGTPMPNREMLCLFLCQRELAIGGSPVTIMNAFNLTIKDLDGKPVYPLPTEESAPEEETKSLSFGD